MVDPLFNALLRILKAALNASAASYPKMLLPACWSGATSR